MFHIRSLHLPWLAGAVVCAAAGLATTATSAQAQAQDCRALIDAFNKAVDGGREAEGQTLVDKIATDAQCARFQVPAQRRLAAFRLQAAQILMARGRPVADYDRLLSEAEKPHVLWQAAATMGEVRFGERRFADAARSFDRAIDVIKNESLTPNAPSKFEIEGLVDRAAQSRLLAANTKPGQEGEAFVKTARSERDGKLGGLYSDNVRGVVPRAIPVPITFEYRKADFTSIGEEAARELLTAIQEQRPSKVVLIGHTDVRGLAETNLKLSRERAEAVATFLRQNGIDVPVEVVGKGSTDPMRLSDTSGLTQDDIYSLNRRVEWRRE
jgi:outer membrane protein OmpA-like peptidoglycan-associated protein